MLPIPASAVTSPRGDEVAQPRERAKERGLGRNAKRKAGSRLVEGQVTTNWKEALAQLSLVYPERINQHLKTQCRLAYTEDLTGPSPSRFGGSWPAWASTGRRPSPM